MDKPSKDMLKRFYENNQELRSKLNNIEVRSNIMLKCLDIWGSKGHEVVVSGYNQCMDAISKDWPQPLPEMLLIRAREIIYADATSE